MPYLSVRMVNEREFKTHFTPIDHYRHLARFLRSIHPSIYFVFCFIKVNLHLRCGWYSKQTKESSIPFSFDIDTFTFYICICSHIHIDIQMQSMNWLGSFSVLKMKLTNFNFEKKISVCVFFFFSGKILVESVHYYKNQYHSGLVI